MSVTHAALTAERILATLKDLGFTHVVGLPDSEANFMYHALESDPNLTLVQVCREGETMAIALGLTIGGKQPVCLIQNTGFFEAGDSIRGMALDIGLPMLLMIGYRGIALAHPDRRVIVLDGDGSILMNLGSLVTIAHQQPDLVHVVFENGVYETTGGQPVPGVGTFDLAKIAAGAGYPHVYDLADEAHLDDSIAEAFAQRGPTFIRLRVEQVGHRTPVTTRIQQQTRDLMAALAEPTRSARPEPVEGRDA
jgi:thiamine pyrophosphate-dependent acetolactate synthase large subunit-like protein